MQPEANARAAGREVHHNTCYKGQAVFTAHEERPRSLHRRAAFLSLQREEESGPGNEDIVSQACFDRQKNPHRFDALA